MIALPTEAEPVKVVEGDCLTTMRSLPASSVDLVLTDPPYFKVKGEWWDRQWDTPAEFVAWMGTLCDEWKRVLKPNGSLYVFASPQMAWHVEGVVRERFNVLNRVTWVKHDGNGWDDSGGKWRQACKEELRCLFPRTEAIIFAEQHGADRVAGEEAGYRSKCDEAARDVFGKYITATRAKHGLTMKDLTAAIGAHGAVNHGGACSNWEAGFNVPTRAHYDTLQAKFLGCFDREYESLRSEYESLRRPFMASASRPYTDVWDFPTVGDYPGKHPCEKPLAMMEHIIETSSRPGALVLDCFAGSGVVGEAARNYGRRALLCEIEAKWCRTINRRLSQGDLFSEVLATASHEESGLLAGIA